MDFKLGFNSSNNNSNTSNNSSSERSSGSISKCRPPPAPDASAAMPTKIPRTDSSFSNGQQQHSGSKIGQACSPTDSSTEDSIHVPISSSSPAPSIHQQEQQHQQNQQQNQNEQCTGLLMPPPPSYQMGNLRQPQQQPLFYQQYKQPGLHLGSPIFGLADAFMGPRYPFTALQWAELEHQALVFKYILARAPIPPELVAPIRNSLMQQQSGWGSSTAGGFAAAGGGGGATTGIHTNHLDAEPGRCRRTDGKKWRCARPIVPDQKYCERHINRGRHKKKSGAAASSSGNNPSAGTVAGGTNHAQAATGGSNELLSPNHHQQHHASQFLDASVVQRGSQVSDQQQYSIQQTNQQQQQHQMMMMLRGNHSGGFNASSTGSSNNVSQFQAVPLQSGYQSGGTAAAAEGLSMKDRFLNGISKATSFDLRPEQLLFSEVSGGTRSSVTLQHHSQQNQNQDQTQSQTHHQHQQQQSPYLTIPTGMNPAGQIPTIPATAGQVLQDHHQIPAVQQQQVKQSSSTSSNPGSPYYSYSKFFQSDETEHCLSTLLPPNQNHHQNFHQQHQNQHQAQQQQSYYLADLAAVDKKPDTSQALRQLFNDWPRSRDASTMTSWSDSEENKHGNDKNSMRAFKSKTPTNNNKTSSYSTHLSISIPASATETTTTTTTTTTASDHDDQAPNANTSNVLTAAHNDLRLCMGSFFCSDDVADSATNNPSKSSLIGSSSSGSVELGWFSAARASVGGPLAEAFNASEVKSAGFSFLLGGNTAATPAHAATQHVVSPTGVLQKATLGSFSESSSSASSPGSIKVEQLH